MPTYPGDDYVIIDGGTPPDAQAIGYERKSFDEIVNVVLDVMHMTPVSATAWDATVKLLEALAANKFVVLPLDAVNDMYEQTASQEREIAALRSLVAEGIEAIRLTKEYTNVKDEHGNVLLPDLPGWSHYDWTTKATDALS